MKLVFCGTPEFAVPALNALIAAGHQIALVLTQPDRASGRGLEVQASPVKRCAFSHGLPVLQPEKLKTNTELRETLEDIAPDAIVVVAYGRIIPDWMLSLPRHGNINLHGSLLPKYRGAAPVQWAIANGEVVTGVTTMRLDAGLDTGDMLLAQSVPIGEEQIAVDVFDILAEVGAEMMVQTLSGLDSGDIFPVPQDHSLATLAPILTREDGRVDFERTAKQILDRWRGFYPWPGAHTTFRGKKMILHGLSVREEQVPANAAHPLGGIVPDANRLRAVCTGPTFLTIEELQIEGRKRMTGEEFLRGYQVKSGEVLGR